MMMQTKKSQNDLLFEAEKKAEKLKYLESESSVSPDGIAFHVPVKREQVAKPFEFEKKLNTNPDIIEPFHEGGDDDNDQVDYRKV